MLSAHLEEYLSSTLENQLLKNGTNNIGTIRTVDNELKPKTKNLEDAQGEKEKQDERNAVRSNIKIKSRAIDRDKAQE